MARLQTLPFRVAAIAVALVVAAAIAIFLVFASVILVLWIGGNLIFLAVLLGTKEAGLWGAIFGVPIVGVIYSMAVQLYRQRRKRLANVTKERKELPLTAVAPGEGVP